MKKIIYCFVGWLCGLAFSWGQGITSAEYFFDTDPGVGSGTDLSVDINAGQIGQTYSIPTTNLSEGYHSLYVRTQSDEGVWSHYDRQIFFIMTLPDPNQNIVSAEYFFDEDPGFGQATELSLSAGSLVQTSQSLSIPATELEEGIHLLFIRVRSSSGVWSLYDSRSFEVSADALDASVELNGNTITANLEGATYQWLDCNNGNSPIVGEVTRSFTPSESGSYAVNVNVDNRTTISICTEVTIGTGADQDGDGVSDNLDQCPDTPSDAIVDVEGCPIFTLPADNFAVTVIGESCISSDNGSIEIIAKTPMNYNATLTGASGAFSEQFSEGTLFQGLMAGSYSLCIGLEGQPDYEQCFDISLTQPEALSASAKVNAQSKMLELSLAGSQTYTISFNNETLTTSESKISLALNAGGNSISVRGDAQCQGRYEETIFLGTEALIYPNPIETGNLYVDMDFTTSSKNAQISLFNLNGALILEEEQSIDRGRLLLEMDDVPKGIYILTVKTDEILMNQKIVKR